MSWAFSSKEDMAQKRTHYYYYYYYCVYHNLAFCAKLLREERIYNFLAVHLC